MASNFAANRVKAAKYHVTRSVINHNIYAGGALQSLNITALFTNNATLHFFVFQLDAGDGSLGSYFASHAFHGLCDNQRGSFFGVFLGFFLELGNKTSEIVTNIAFGHLHQLFSSISFTELGNLFELFLLLHTNVADLIFELLNFGLCGAQSFGSLINAIELFIECFFTVEQSLFNRFEFFAAALFVFACFFGNRSGIFASLRQLFIGLFFSLGNLFFCLFLARAHSFT